MKILEKWEKEISNYPKLKFNEAKELYLSFLSCNNEELKKSYMDKIIVGTLYVVVNMIKNNDLTALKSNSYDINDIISSANEIWINAINSGVLLEVSCFSEVLSQRDFLSKLSNILIPDEINSSSILHISNNELAVLFKIYLELSKNNDNVIFYDIIDYLYENDPDLLDSFYCYPMEHVWYDAVIKIFKNIVKKMPDINDSIPLTRIKDLLKLFLANGITEKININLEDEIDYEKELVDKYLYSQAYNIVKTCNLTDKEFYVLIHYFGLDGYPSETFENISKSMNLSRGRASAIYNKALYDIRKSNKFSKIIKYKDLR